MYCMSYILSQKMRSQYGLVKIDNNRNKLPKKCLITQLMNKNCLLFFYDFVYLLKQLTGF